MKANELMIGDWVQDITPAVIDAISNEDICTYRTEHGYITANPSNLKPIPLTAEILEKNGLRKVTLDGEKGSKQDYYIDTHIVGYYNMDALTRVHASPIVYDIKQKWLFVDDKTLCRIELMCPCVHALQHALRLCGIDKEIVL